MWIWAVEKPILPFLPLILIQVDAAAFRAIIRRLLLEAPVVELVDAADSKSAIGNDVGVQVPPGAPFIV